MKKRKPEALQTPFSTSAAPGSASSPPLATTSRTALRGARILLPSAASPSPSTQGQKQTGLSGRASLMPAVIRRPAVPCFSSPEPARPRLSGGKWVRSPDTGRPGREHRGAGTRAGFGGQRPPKPRHPGHPSRRGAVTAEAEAANLGNSTRCVPPAAAAGKVCPWGSPAAAASPGNSAAVPPAALPPPAPSRPVPGRPLPARWRRRRRAGPGRRP